MIFWGKQFPMGRNECFYTIKAPSFFASLVLLTIRKHSGLYFSKEFKNNQLNLAATCPETDKSRKKRKMIFEYLPPRSLRANLTGKVILFLSKKGNSLVIWTILNWIFSSIFCPKASKVSNSGYLCLGLSKKDRFTLSKRNARLNARLNASQA